MLTDEIKLELEYMSLELTIKSLTICDNKHMAKLHKLANMYSVSVPISIIDATHWVSNEIETLLKQGESLDDAINITIDKIVNIYFKR